MGINPIRKRTKQFQKDKLIMDILSEHYKYKHLAQLNKYRMALRALSIAHLTTLEGTWLQPWLFGSKAITATNNFIWSSKSPPTAHGTMERMEISYQTTLLQQT